MAASAGVVPLVLGVAEGAFARPPNGRIRVAAIGCGDKGMNDLRAVMAAGNVEVAAVCDIVEGRGRSAAAEVADRQNRRPRVERDFRRVLEIAGLDAVIVAAPAALRARIAVEACQAGADVYVDAPAFCDTAEALALVRAARRRRRVVQVGLPLRSTRHIQRAVDLIRSGQLGRVGLCRVWTGSRTGQADDAAAHLLDLVGWVMDGSRSILASATAARPVGKEGENPSRMTAYDWPGFRIVWESSSRIAEHPEGASCSVAFYGTDGTLVADFQGWQACREPTGEIIDQATGSPDHAAHVRDFLECVRTRRCPAADIENIAV